MKRFLKNNQHQLNRREQEDIWRGIQEKSGRTGAPRKRRGLGMPIFGLTSLTAAVLLIAVWFNHQDAQEKIGMMGGNQNRVAEMEIIDPGAALVEQTPAVNPEPVKNSDKYAIDQVEEALRKQVGAETTDPVRDGRLADIELKVDRPQISQSVDEPPAAKPAEKSDKYPVKSVEDALAKQTGVVSREGEIDVRGGRSGEVVLDSDSGSAGVGKNPATSPETTAKFKSQTLAEGRAQVRSGAKRLAFAPDAQMPSSPGSITGGTTPPNGETFETMYHEHTGVNPFVATEEDALSTFAVDVDNASYTLTRSYLQRGSLPPKDAIRVEEFVNFFGGGYASQTKDVFQIHTDGSASRFGQGYQMLRVGLKGMDIDSSSRKPANLIFVIDTSGSMSREDRLGLVKKSLHILLDELGEGDRVGIVTYGSRGQVLLQPTDISRKDLITAAIDQLGPNGATNACEGLELAYDLARRNYDPALINRLVLCSDGVANMGGATRAEEMLAKIRRSSDEGITLSAIGFGMGNYNDVLMEKLANQGDGNYYYVDKLEESERVFRANLTGLLQTIAREVKIQVEFDPGQVQRWRLLGYENRDVADRDFRNDSVDAGEVGAGHQVTALYELKLKSPEQSRPLDEDEFGAESLGTVRVRYEFPAHDPVRAGQVKEIEHPIGSEDLGSRFSRSSSRYRLQVLAAEFAEILRESYWAKESALADLVPMADGLAKEVDGDQESAVKAKELARLIRLAADLQAQQDAREVPNLDRD